MNLQGEELPLVGLLLTGLPRLDSVIFIHCSLIMCPHPQRHAKRKENLFWTILQLNAKRRIQKVKMAELKCQKQDLLSSIKDTTVENNWLTDMDLFV